MAEFHQPYEVIVDVLPIVSVEAVIVKDDFLLLMKRNNPPGNGH